MSEHRYDKSISESCVDPNRLMVERQDPDNLPRLQTRERCALEIAAYVFKHESVDNYRGGSRIYGKGVHMYKRGVCFADLIVSFLNIS